MSKTASFLGNNFMFYVIRNAEKINVLCLQTTDSYSSVEQLLLLIIYIVIVVQRHQHGSISLSAIQTWLKKMIVTISYAQYAKLPKVTMICL